MIENVVSLYAKAAQYIHKITHEQT